LTLSAKHLFEWRSLRIFGKEVAAMALSNVQIGLIGQMEFVKLGTLGSKGALDFASPDADDDRRDHEIHRRGRFGATLAVQTKVSTMLLRVGRYGRMLFIRFDVPKERLVSSSMFWYFFAHLRRDGMRFADPCFLVPSRMVHKHCLQRGQGGLCRFSFLASLKPDSGDRWVEYRVESEEVGRRLMGILDGLSAIQVDPEESERVLELPQVAIIRRRRGALR
jgi:hypothetical protein